MGHSAFQRQAFVNVKSSGLVLVSVVRNTDSASHGGGSGHLALNTVALDSEGARQPQQG